MLLPTFSTAAPHPGLAIIFFGQERDMPHGFFGDRDARAPGGTLRIPPYCGLFGRRGDAPAPRPAESDARDDGVLAPRGRA